jgi:predicted phosphodiesterase
VAVFGGVYSNWLALEAALADMERRGVDAVYCLGDLGAFGPHPDRTVEILRERGIPVLRGNYDDSLARGLDDCQCGYTDPRDNHYARLSYRYTFARTHPDHRRWMGTLPSEIRFRLGGRKVLCCHGSPRRTNEFLWESTTPTHFLAKLARDHDADVVLGTHTGIHWCRAWGPSEAGAGGRPGLFANVGALGRPANDGRTEVWYALLESEESEESEEAEEAEEAEAAGEARGPVAAPEVDRVQGAGAPREPDPARNGADAGEGGGVSVEFVPVAYDHPRLAAEMRAEDLPEEFVETVLTGWWTTCLEILPGKERARGRF